jgi:hypothetical protein
LELVSGGAGVLLWQVAGGRRCGDSLMGLQNGGWWVAAWQTCAVGPGRTLGLAVGSLAKIYFSSLIVVRSSVLKYLDSDGYYIM